MNGRGLDIKLRLPNGLDVLELPLRDLAAKRLKRGNVSGTLTLSVRLPPASPPICGARAVKDLAIDLADSIPGALPPRAELLLALPGVMRSVSAQDDNEEMQAAWLRMCAPVLPLRLKSWWRRGPGRGRALPASPPCSSARSRPCTRRPGWRQPPSRLCTRQGFRRSSRKSSAARLPCRKRKSPRNRAAGHQVGCA